jgi:hypothetical protein
MKSLNLNFNIKKHEIFKVEISLKVDCKTDLLLLLLLPLPLSSIWKMWNLFLFSFFFSSTSSSPAASNSFLLNLLVVVDWSAINKTATFIIHHSSFISHFGKTQMWLDVLALNNLQTNKNIKVLYIIMIIPTNLISKK